MSVKNKWKTAYTYLPVAFLGVYAYVIFSQIGFLPGDDEIYRDTFASIGLGQWCQEFYQQWSGRIPLQLLDILFLNLPLIFWKIINMIFYMIVPLYTCRISRLFLKEKNRSGFFLSLYAGILLVKIPDEITASAVKWITGSFNYLWPTAGLLLGVYPLLVAASGGKCKRLDGILGIVGTFLACYAEQTAAVYVCLGLFCVIEIGIKKQKKRMRYRVYYLFGVVNACILFAAPGNQVRSDAELLRWYPNFAMYQIADRFWMGAIHTIKEVFVSGYPFFFCMLLLLGILAVQKQRFLQICYAGLLLLTELARKIAEQLEDEAIWQIYNTKLWIGLGVLVFWMLFFAWFLFCVFEMSLSGAIGALLFLAVFASGTVVGMSPTIYASGSRIYFLSYVLLTLLCVLILGAVLEKREKAEIKQMITEKNGAV